MNMPTIEVKPVGKLKNPASGKSEWEARFGLYVNGILIGDSKNQFDADHAKVMLEKALTSIE